MSIVLQTDALVKDYGNKIALAGINLNLESGKIIGLLGSNGSGKTTFLKLTAGILTPTTGNISVCGIPVGVETKRLVSFLPERTYLNDWMRISEMLEFFADFYEDFEVERAKRMLLSLGVDENAKLRTLSKGTREKVQLVLVMSRRAKLYLLDEPIAGVDPVAREYILNTIISTYNKEASIIISTHLISDVESVLDEYAFILGGRVLEHGDVKTVREEKGISLDQYFKEVFKCSPNC
jgi:ABC-2 type transport system ATP-binding protein